MRMCRPSLSDPDHLQAITVSPPNTPKNLVPPSGHRKSVQIPLDCRSALGKIDEAREKDEKHSVAVRYAVDSLRRSGPKMRISETEVKRILSTFRPRGSGTILRFERSTLGEEDIKRHRWIKEQFAALQKEKGITLQVPPVYDETLHGAKFTIRFAERPNYPRHNCKTS